MSLYDRPRAAESKGPGLNRVDIRELASGREGDVRARTHARDRVGRGSARSGSSRRHEMRWGASIYYYWFRSRLAVRVRSAVSRDRPRARSIAWRGKGKQRRAAPTAERGGGVGQGHVSL